MLLFYVCFSATFETLGHSLHIFANLNRRRSEEEFDGRRERGGGGGGGGIGGEGGIGGVGGGGKFSEKVLTCFGRKILIRLRKFGFLINQHLEKFKEIFPYS